MASSDVSVTFDADISSFRASLQSATQSVRDFGNQVKDAATPAADAFAPIDAAIKNVVIATAGLATATLAIDRFSSMMQAARVAAAASTTAIGAGVAAVGNATGLTTATSAVARFSSVLQAARVAATASTTAIGAGVAAAGSATTDVLITMGAASIALVGGLAIAALEYAKLAQTALQTQASVDQVAKAMSAAGNAGALQTQTTVNGYDLSNKAIQDYLATLQQIPGVTQADAAAIQSALGSMNNYSVPLNEVLIEYIKNVARSRDEAVNLGSTLQDVFSDPINKGKAYIDTLGGATTAEQIHFAAAQQSGNVNRTAAALMDVLSGRIRMASQATTESTRALLQNAQTFQGSSNAYSTFIAGLESSLDRQNAAIEKNIAEINKRNEVLRNQPQDLAQTVSLGIKAGDQQNSLQLARQSVQTQVEQIGAALDALRAKFAAGAGTPEMANQILKLGMELDAAKTKVQGLDNQLQGGSPYQRRIDGIQQYAVLANQDAVTTAQRQIQADREALANADLSVQERIEINRNYYQHLQALRQADSALAKAKADLDAANATTGSKAELDAKTAAITAEQKQYAQGSAEYIQLEKQKLDATTAYETERTAIAAAQARIRAANAARGSAEERQAQLDALNASRSGKDSVSQQLSIDAQVAEARRAMREQDAQDAQRAEDTKFQIAQNGATEQMSLIREQAQAFLIDRNQELAALLAANAQKEALERRHTTTIRNLYEAGSTAYKEAQQKIDEVASQSALARQKIEQEVDRAIVQDYRQSFEKIGSTVSGEIGSLIKGQETLGQAFQNIALSILQDWIAARVKMVADWAAGQAAQVAQTTAAEAAKTSAVATGVAARTGLDNTGAASSMIATAAAVIKSIEASASETFAGIFGFLSPIMGPAAAGPAAAGQATVAAVAGSVPSFAVGAWSLPADMLAQVHAGEMIVPAGPAQTLRDALSGTSSAAVAPSVTLHHTTSINVSAVDGASVASFFQNNAKPLLRAINNAVKNGTHLGLSALNRA